MPTIYFPGQRAKIGEKPLMNTYYFVGAFIVFFPSQHYNTLKRLLTTSGQKHVGVFHFYFYLIFIFTITPYYFIVSIKKSGFPLNSVT